jgi:hypothetical protein
MQSGGVVVPLLPRFQKVLERQEDARKLGRILGAL